MVKRLVSHAGRKAFAAILALGLALCLLPKAAHAADNQVHWSLPDGSGGTGDMVAAVIAANTVPNTTITLDGNITSANFPITFTGANTILDLNGYSINRNQSPAIVSGNVITVNAGASLTVKDSRTGGKITGGRNTDSGGGVIVNGSFTLQSGEIFDNTADVGFDSKNGGGGVYVGNGGRFVMTGGTISGNSVITNSATFAKRGERGGGVFVSGTNSEFTMTGGTIAGNRAAFGGGVGVAEGLFTMSGTAQILTNTAVSGAAGESDSRGGGVYVVNNGRFIMTGGTIGGDSVNDKNVAKSGGGVHVANGASFTMSGTARIAHNTAGNASDLTSLGIGGGVYIMSRHQDEAQTQDVGQFIMNGGTITENTANMGGGVSNGGSFTFNSGEISENSAVRSGGGVNSNGTSTMMGGSITENTVTATTYGDGYGGGLFVGGSTFDMQGGTISNNNASNGTSTSSGGGGVAVVKGTFTMSSGASVSGNTAKNGGGIYAYREDNGSGGFNYGTFHLAGGSVTGNSADTVGGGVYVGNDVVFVSGVPTVSGNTNGNVYLPTNAFVRAKGALTGGSIGVTVTTQASALLTKVAEGSGYTLTANDTNVFRSDNPAFGVEFAAAAGSVPAHARLGAPGAAPAITAQPANQTVTEGGTATFTVAATGTPAPSYRWQVNRGDGNGFVDIPGATGASYTTAAVTLANNGYQYRCILYNSAGSITSRVATLIIGTPGGDVGPDVPKTGDSSLPGLWAGLALLAGAGIIALRRKRQA